MSFSLPLLNKLVRRAALDKHGNVAVIFAFVLIPLLGLVGAAVDYTRANAARTTLQAALDSTALMISKDIANIPAAQIQSRAQQYFNALYTNTSAPVSDFKVAYTPNNGTGSTVVVSASGTMQTDFLKVLGSGLNQLQIGSSSTTTWGQTKLRVAMALDNTGSMADDGKIGALRTSATNLVNTLKASAAKDGDVLISLVPFAKDVNAGASNYTKGWIDWTAWEAEAPAIKSKKPTNWSSIGPGSSCPWTMQSNGFTCLSGPGSKTVVTKIPSSGSYKGMICPGPDPSSRYAYAYHYLINGCYDSVQSGSTYTHTWRPNAHSTWSGCITDRAEPNDTTNTAPSSGSTATLFPAEQYYENSQSFCSSSASPPLQQIVPLSFNWDNLTSQINSMQPTGGTNQVIGLAWGWLTLMQGDPMNAVAEDPNFIYSRIIILLSDGINTENARYGNGSDYSSQVDAREKILCDAVKAAKDSKGRPMYSIFTIQLNTGGDATSSILQYCASDPSQFVEVKSSGQLITAFDNIGARLSALRIAQ
ncbi:MAG: pilus assembly protein [Xanthobacteraceae bacterium]|nr:pilus assembly protein [Xanthobacteraceae bacterium]